MTKNGETIRKILAREKRKLPCKLGGIELLERGSTVGALEYEIESLESQAEGLKSEVKSLVAQVEKKQRELRSLSRVLRTKQEEREVIVQVEVDRQGLVREIRVDTNEVLRERNLTAQEAQTVMPFSSGEEVPEGEEGVRDVNAPALPAHEEEEEEEETGS